MAKQNILYDIASHFREGRGTPWATREGVQDVMGKPGAQTLFELVNAECWDVEGWNVYVRKEMGRVSGHSPSGDFLAVGSTHPPFVMEGQCPSISLLRQDLSVITGYLQERGRTPGASVALGGIGVAPFLANVSALVNDMVLHHTLNTPEIFPGIYQLTGYTPTSPAVYDGATGAIFLGTILLGIVAIAASLIPFSIHSRQAMRDFSSRLSPQAAGYRTLATEGELYRPLLQQPALTR